MQVVLIGFKFRLAVDILGRRSHLVLLGGYVTWQQSPKEAQGLSDNKQTHQFSTFLLLFITFQLESLRFDWNVSRQCFSQPTLTQTSSSRRVLFTGQITLTGPVWSINYKPKLIRKHHICNERGTARLALSPSAHLFTLYISPVISSLDNTRFVLRLSTGWLHVHRYRCKHRLPQRVWSVVGAAASGPVFVAVQRAGKDSSDRLIFSWPWNPP